MINFTTTLSYGLRFLANLARQGSQPKSLKKIAVEENISLLYLRKLIFPLEKKGLIKSIKGPGGGFILLRRPSDISLYEVVNILSHNKIMSCLKDSASCLRYEDCLIKDLLEEVYSKVQEIFKNKTLEAIVKKKATSLLVPSRC